MFADFAVSEGPVEAEARMIGGFEAGEGCGGDVAVEAVAVV